MDLLQLRAFVALAELKHFGQAAARLHITQPALTKRIRSLEATVGTALFARGWNGTTLTPGGEALLPAARQITTDADAWLARARNVAKGIDGRLAIGFGLSTIEIAPRMVASFRRACPNVEVSLNDYSSAEQLQRLHDNRLDLGFVRLPVREEGLFSHALATDSLALASTKAHASFDGEACNELGFVMLSRPRGPGLRAQIDEWCRASSFNPKITQTADDIQTVLALVAAGVGVSVLPRQAAHLLGSAVELRPLEGPGATWKIGAVWRSDSRNPALQAFLQIITAHDPTALSGQVS